MPEAPLKKEGKSRSRFVLLAVIMILLVGTSIAIMTHDDSIASRAIPLGRTVEWACPNPSYGFYTVQSTEWNALNAYYIWTNSGETITFRRNATGLQGFKTTFSPNPNRQSSVPLPGLNLTGKPEPVSLSHDGKWLLWYDHKGNFNFAPKITSMNTIASESFPIVTRRNYAWSRDDTSILFSNQTSNATDIVSQGIQDKREKVVRSDNTTLHMGFFMTPGVTSEDVSIMQGDLITHELFFLNFALKTPSAPLRKSPVKLSPKTRLQMCLLSPNGEKLFLMTEKTELNFFERLIKQWRDSLNPQFEVKRFSCYVVNRHGDRVDLGTFDSVLSSSRTYSVKAGTGIGGMKWTPDSKNISFIYQGMLYKLPVSR